MHSINSWRCDSNSVFSFFQKVSSVWKSRLLWLRFSHQTFFSFKGGRQIKPADQRMMHSVFGIPEGISKSPVSSISMNSGQQHIVSFFSEANWMPRAVEAPYLLAPLITSLTANHSVTLCERVSNYCFPTASSQLTLSHRQLRLTSKLAIRDWLIA